MATFNGIDYAIFILLFLSVAMGIARGFVKEIISLFAWIAAFAVATLYSVKLAALLPGPSAHLPGMDPVDSASLISIVMSYLVLFIGTLICGSIVKFIANYIVEGSGLGVFNRLLGAIFGFARGCVIVLLALFFLAFTALSMHALWKDSKLVAVFHPGVKWLNHIAQPYLAEIEAKMKKSVKNLNQEDLSDVIKPKPMDTTPPVTTVAPVATPPAPVAPAPVVNPPVKVPPMVVTPPAAPAALPPTPTPQTAPQTP